MSRILYAQPIAEKIQRILARQIKKTTKRPMLAIVLVGNNAASERFILHKVKKAEELSLGVRLVHLPSSIPAKTLERTIQDLNKDREVAGIVLQLPLPKKFSPGTIIATIDPTKDIDNLWGDSPYTSPTVQAIWELLGATRMKNLKHKNVLIVGYGRLVGKPLHEFLKKKGYTSITIADKLTRNLSDLLTEADIVITGTGKPQYITNIKKGAVVIDAGTTNIKGKLYGDVDFKRVAPKASFITPVPGGVGVLTVLLLYKNLIKAAAYISE